MVLAEPNKIQETQFFCFSGDYGREKANFWQSPDYSLNFKADDDNLNFDNRSDLGEANGNYSSGLLFLGSAGYSKRGFADASLF
ncbi:hypothetical protein KJ866_01305 [Patescibacteria group bacterium]|nr:hypothetical protein [Patescibacteria group bacterium]MBU2220215.1 hypothetical protein [Patescibacteria group bacterium]MBU2265058.1 hypothetical protein [Patescibacteria group bacterium]